MNEAPAHKPERTTLTELMDRGSWSVEHFDKSRERTWHLSVLISGIVEAWAAHATEDGSLVAIQWSALGGVLDAEEVPTHPVSVSFINLPEWSALVPEGAMEPGSQAAHLRAVHGGVPTGALRDEPLAVLGANCIYVHDDVAERSVLDRFPHARPVPMRSLMVRAAISRCMDGTIMVMHRGQENLEVAVAENGRILLSNTYPVRSSQDVLYFALLAAEGSGLKPAATSVLACGTHLVPHETDLLRRYFNTHDTVMNGSLALPAESGVVPQRWLALLDQFICVS